MSLTGSLSTMALADVLGWIGTTNRKGVLVVRGVGSETHLSLRRGRIVECAASEPASRLGQFLLFHGVIDEEILDRGLRAHAAQGQRLGEVLVDMGAVSSEDMEEALKAKAEETVLGSFDEPTGWFTFDPNVTDLDAPLQLDMLIADGIARGDTRAKNTAVAVAALKREGSTLRKTSKAPSAKLSSVWPLRNAYALVDGERSIDEIVLHMHGTESHVIQRLHQLFLEGFIDVAERSDNMASSSLQFGIDTIAAPEVTDASTFAKPRRVESWDGLDGIIPTALPPELAKDSRNLSLIEKYLLTLCDGTRDLHRITAVAPVQSQVVLETIRSLTDRGWLKASPPASDH